MTRLARRGKEWKWNGPRIRAFILNQDYRLVIVAAVVLMTVLAGLVIGLSSSNPLAH